MINPTLPLVDLHRHLDGNIRPETIWQLAEKHHIVLPVKQFDDFLPLVQIQKNEPDLISFLSKLDWGVSVLKTLDDCRRIAMENVEDAKKAGLDYAELRFSPYYMAKTHQLPIQGVVEAVIDGVASASKTLEIPINLIGILSRTFGAQTCMQELNALLAHQDKLVAIDLAGDELHYPGDLFVEHFEKVKKTSLNITIHAGEAAGSESIWQAIKQLGANRIGHGVATITDEKLMDYMINHNITIESCLTSNLQTGTVKDLTRHPLKTFLAAGLSVCLNTDDPAVEATEIQQEYALASETLGLSEQQLNQLQLNGLHASYLSDNDKKQLITKKQR